MLNEKQIFPIKTATSCRLKWSWSSLILTTGETDSCHRSSKSFLTPENFNDFHNTAEKIRDLRGTRVLGSLDGTLFALFDSTGRLARTIDEYPDWTLERVVETVG